MGYATSADLVERFGEREVIQLTNRDNPRAEALDEAIAAGALNDAASEINSYLAGRYALPLADPPKVLVRLACDIARYCLHGAMGRVSEVVDQRYQDAVKFLKAVSKGEATLGIAEPQVVSEPQLGGPMIAPGRRGFDERALEGWL